MKKILVASRNSIVRHGIALMTQTATPHTVVGDDRPLSEIDAMVEHHRPDLLIVDLSGRAQSADEVVHHVEMNHRQVGLLVLLDGGSAQDATPVERLHGRSSSLAPCATPATVLKTIVAALEGATRTSACGGAVGARTHRQHDWAPGATVTPRERQVMELIRRGMCNKSIARAMGISITTVRTHRQKLMAKLGLHNAVEVARFASSELLL